MRDDNTAGPRAAPHDLVIADATERQRAFRRARRNSVFVRMMRIILPVATLCLLSTYGLFMQHRIRIETGDVVGTLNTGPLTGTSLENFTMTSPSYQGYNAKNGSRYHVKADRALTDLSRDKPIELTGISGTLQQADGRTTNIEAAKGIFDQKKRTLELTGGISVAAPNDLAVRLQSALVDAATTRITSREPVEVSMPDGGVRSNAFELDQKNRKIFFTDGVTANLIPRAGQPPKQPEPKAASTNLTALGSDTGPITITSTRLEVSDVDRTAYFQGDVRANQSGRTLTAPELTVTLAKGARLPGLGSGPKNAPRDPQQRAGVEKLIAEKGVVLADANGEVRAGRAQFFVTRNEAHLSNAVEIKGARGGSVTADTATIETGTSRIVLTGKVIAEQNQTLLRGTRLVYEREGARLSLTAPAQPGTPKGRIFARLKPAAARPRRNRTNARASQSRLAFTTDPNAPVEITAASLDVTDTNETARFTGGVRARQGSFLLTAPTLVTRYTGRIGLDGTQARGGAPVTLKTIRAAGPVEITSANDVAATGDRALYDAGAEQVTLTGNVVLRQGRQIVRGEKLTVDLKTGRARVENAGRGKTTAKPLQHGAAPKITANRNQRDCGGRMCAVFFPRDFEQQRAKPQARSKPGAQKPSISNGWSTSTTTN